MCDPTESDGTEIPSAILTIEEVNTAGAGNVSIRALIAGRVRLEKLVYDGGATVDIATRDALRGFGIIALALVGFFAAILARPLLAPEASGESLGQAQPSSDTE